jgi:hypothetical protein
VSLGDETAQRLEAATADLLDASAAFAPRLHDAPTEGEWSAMQNLAHVAEFVPFWSQRVRDFALGSLGERMFGRTPEEWDQRSDAVEQHAADALASAQQRVRDGAALAARALREVPDAAWDRTVQLEDGGQFFTLQQVVEQRVIGHLRSHIRQASDAAGQS